MSLGNCPEPGSYSIARPHGRAVVLRHECISAQMADCLDAARSRCRCRALRRWSPAGRCTSGSSKGLFSRSMPAGSRMRITQALPPTRSRMLPLSYATICRASAGEPVAADGSSDGSSSCNGCAPCCTGAALTSGFALSLPAWSRHGRLSVVERRTSVPPRCGRSNGRTAARLIRAVCAR